MRCSKIKYDKKWKCMIYLGLSLIYGLIITDAEN